MSKVERRRRIRRIRRNRRIAALTCFMIFSVMIAMTFGRTEVTANQDSYKYYTDVRVEVNDTLWGIASDYYSSDYKNMTQYVKEIMEINDLHSDTVSYGQVLVIPYYSSELK